MLTPGHMSEWGLAGAVGLGLLTALHPCPLSTLAAAILVVFAPAQSPGRNLIRGGALIAGMSMAYAFMTAAIVGGLLRVPFLSAILPAVIRPFLAPLLIAVGILQTGLFSRPGNPRVSAWIARRLQGQGWGLAGVAALGMGLALAFCPATAGLFFGALIPLALTRELPALYALGFGVGHGLPLLLVTAALARGVQVETIRRRTDRWAMLSGWALIAVGAYLTGQLLGE